MANLSENLYSTLKRSIISGSYAPGTRLREEHLAQEMNVSRTPVRNALARLVQEGLLQQSGRATLVAGWTDWDIAEIFELRLLLEPHGAGLAAQRATPQEVDAMEAINDDMRRWALSTAPDRLENIQESNRRFHHAILDAARSGRLRDMLDTYLDTPQIIGSFYFYSSEDILSSIDHHRQITQAIRAGNRPLAQESMRFHLHASFARYQSTISQAKDGQGRQMPATARSDSSPA